MNDPIHEDLLPVSISDEAAYVLSEFLNDLALACDEKYYAQIRRYFDNQMRESSESSESSECDAIPCSTYENNINNPPF